MRTDVETVRLRCGEEVRIVRETVRLDGPQLHAIEVDRPEEPGSLVQGWCYRADPDVPIPFWAELWPASRAIAHRLASGAPLGGIAVLDLGCGLGVAGIAAGLRGGMVTFADRDADALVFARRNARLAGLVDPGFVVMDWRASVWARAFDLVIAADVVYDLVDHEPVASLIDSLVLGGGKAWLGDPHRTETARFIADWCATPTRTAVALSSGRAPGSDVEITIHELRSDARSTDV